MTESDPKPMSAVEDARVPVTSAMRSSFDNEGVIDALALRAEVDPGSQPDVVCAGSTEGPLPR